MTSLSERVARLSPDKRRLYIAALSVAKPAPPPLERLSGDAPAPLSFGQARLWFLERLHPASGAYTITRAWRLSGSLDIPALQAALDAVTIRHPALRTVFGETDGVPFQRVRSELRCAFRTAAPPTPDEESLRRFVAAEATAPFDLAAGPPMRAVLAPLGPDDHLLVVSFHHIVFDGWSLGVFVRDLSDAYGASGPAGGPAPVSPGDAARWQRRWFDAPFMEAQAEWWRERFASPPGPLALPVEPAGPAGPDIARTFRAPLPAALPAHLAALAAETGTTLFMVLLAGYAALLSRVCGTDDLVVGVPVAGRPLADMENSVGFFVNMLALRLPAGGDPSFSELLRRVRERSLDALARQDLPFDRLVEEMRRDPSDASASVLRTTFQLRNFPATELRLAGIEAVPVHADETTGIFDLSLDIEPAGGELVALFAFRTRLFREETIRALASAYTAVLSAAAAAPATRLSRLPLDEPARTAARAAAAAGPAIAYPRESTIPAVFLGRPECASASVAGGGTELSRTDILARAGGVARTVGREPGTRGFPVALSVRRGPAAPAAFLGVMLAGGACVPIDPDWPESRRSAVIRDSGARTLLVDASTPRIPGGVRTIVLDEVRDAPPPAPPPSGGGDPALVMYTSGSTGNPKGAVIPHRAILRLTLGADYVRIASGDRVAQISNLAFDAASFEIWGALLTGARLVVLDDDTVLSPGRLAAALVRERISVMFVTTALFNAAAAVLPAAFRTLDTLLFGGETADPAAVAAVLEAGAPRRLLNVYGPTENTTFSTWHEIDASSFDPGAAVPIGRAIAGSSAFVLDRSGAPLPEWLPGEICVGGDGVASGYLNDPALTAARFLPDPFSGRPGARLYRTGDRGRLLPGGAIDFLGRLDDQVKIRGHRVEPGEVETLLRSHRDVAQCAVAVRSDPAAGPFLAAYVVPAAGRPFCEQEILRHLRECLPAWSVPRFVAAIDALPIGPTGKIDRRALPPPRAAVRAAGEFRDGVERRLAGLWAEVLGAPPAGPEADFFDSGGHSLLALRLFAGIRGVFGVDVAVSAIFDAPTLGGLASVIRGRTAPPGGGLVALRAHGSRSPLFIVPGGGGGEWELLVYGPLVRFLPPDLPVFGFAVERERTGRDAAAIAAYCRDLIAARAPLGPVAVVGECLGGIVAFELARLLEDSGRDVTLMLLDTRFPAPRTRIARRLLSWRPAALAASAFAEAVALLREDPSLRPARLRSVAGRVRGLAARLVRPSAVPPDERLRARARAAYPARVLRARPGPYRGRAFLILSAGFPDRAAEAAWRRVAPNLALLRVPGSHFSYVRTHARETARAIASCLHP